mgnify:CR=1 FL=1
MYAISTICAIVEGRFQQRVDDASIAHLVYDSRKIAFAQTSLFFALQTSGNDGHRYLTDAYKKGVRNFVVAHNVDAATLQGSNIIVVQNVLKAFQKLAAHHRSRFAIPVIGITGSNGKTIVKEWLYQLLQKDENMVRSPKSYNSQIGVPLSVWQLSAEHTLGIFEAGISQPGEMAALQQIIQPTIGVLTNIGDAHSEGFASNAQKLAEKRHLFQSADVVIVKQGLIPQKDFKAFLFTWGFDGGASVVIRQIEKEGGKTGIAFSYNGKADVIQIPFADDASIENAITCLCVLLYLGKDLQKEKETFLTLHAVDMRLHLLHGINGCTIINDSYSADLTSLQMALNFLQQQHFNQQRTVILSDFYESGRTDEALYAQIAQTIQQHGIQKAILIGEKVTTYLQPHLKANIAVSLYASTDEFIQQFRTSQFSNEVILVKGARKAHFEQVVQLLEYKVHQTLLQINLNAVAHNLKQYRTLLHPQTKVMAMVKAFAYGSGGAEIAGVLQYNNIDYLGVAYTDEGVDLRKAGITVPIMVMNADETSFAALVEHNLQPVIYSFDLLRRFEDYISAQALQHYGVHIEVETGMNRLGFPLSEMEALSQHLAQSSLLKVESIFSHLAASEDATQDAYTAQQAQTFMQAVQHLQQQLLYPFIRHIANSAAIIRHPQLQFDMVRLGIGLYGIEIATEALQLQAAAILRTTIAQLKQLKAGETVSYNRRGVVKEDSTIATVRIGYADGYSRRFGNGVGKMLVNGHLAPVIGTVCMDMTMLNVTGIPGVREGDEVIVFGAPLPVQQVAGWIDTIPYELMTSVSQRVKRIYFQE